MQLTDWLRVEMALLLIGLTKISLTKSSFLISLLSSERRSIKTLNLFAQWEKVNDIRITWDYPFPAATTWMGDLKCREVKTGFAERDEWKPVLLPFSLAGNLEKPLMSLYGAEWREHGYGLGCSVFITIHDHHLSRQWLISEKSQQTGLKTSSVPA